MRHKLFLLLSFTCIISCGANPIEEKNGKTIISIKTLNHPSNVIDSQIQRSFRQNFPAIFAKKYKEKYKTDPEKYGKYNWNNVEIKFETYSGPRVKGVDTGFAAITSENGPDILYIGFQNSCNYIQRGFIQPLDEYYKTLSQKQISEYINPKIKPVCYQKGPDEKRHWWTLPYGGLLGRVIFFRKDVFDKHKLPYPDKNWTWKDFMRICRKTTDISKEQYGIRFGRGLYESWFWISFLWSAGGEVTAYNKKTGRWEYAFNSDAAVKALDFYTQLSTEKHTGKDGRIYRGYAYKNPKKASAMWESGKIAMMGIYLSEILLLDNYSQNIGIVPFPLGPSGIRGSELNTRMHGLSSQIKHPAIRNAAWEYILYINSARAQKIRIKFWIKKGKGNFINPIYLKKFGYDSLAEKVDKKLVETYKTSIATGVLEPYRAISSSYSYGFMTKPLQYAEKLALENKLAPVGSKKRYQQLKIILNIAVAEANRINNKAWQELKKK